VLGRSTLGFQFLERELEAAHVAATPNSATAAETPASAYHTPRADARLRDGREPHDNRDTGLAI